MVTHEKEEEILAPLHTTLIEDSVSLTQGRRVVEETLLLLKPDATHGHGEILRLIDQAGFAIECTSMVLTRDMAAALVAGFPCNEADEDLHDWAEMNTGHLMSGTVLAVLLRRVNAVQCLQQLLGPHDPAEAKKTRPESIRALYGTDEVRNAAYASPTKEQARRDMVLVLGYTPQSCLDEANKEEGGAGDADWYGQMTTKELRDLAKQQLEELKVKRQEVADKETALKARETLEIQQKLYPNGEAPLQLAVGTGDVFDSTRKIIRHCAAVNPTGIPLAPEDLRMVFDTLDVNKTGHIPRAVFKELYANTPSLENFGVPNDVATLDKQLRPYERGIPFDDFCLLFYQIARR